MPRRVDDEVTGCRMTADHLREEMAALHPVSRLRDGGESVGRRFFATGFVGASLLPDHSAQDGDGTLEGFFWKRLSANSGSPPYQGVQATPVPQSTDPGGLRF